MADQETVKVKPWGKGQGDFVEVNKSDYEANPEKYELLEEETKKTKAPAADVPDDLKAKVNAAGLFVSKNGKAGRASKWIVVGSDAKQVSDAEYSTELEAYTAAVVA